MKQEELQSFYASKAAALRQQVAVFRQRSRYCVAGQLASFLLALVFVGLYTATPGGAWWLVLAALLLAVYLLVRHLDAANTAQMARRRHLLQVYEKEMSYLRGDYSCFDDGARYVDVHHAYTFDLDIFGPGSLYQRLCRAVTTGGADLLSHELSHVSVYRDHRSALRELAAMEPWRADWMAMGQERLIDTREVAAVVQAVGTMRVPRWYASPWAFALACCLLAGFYLSIVLAIAGLVSGSVPFVWGVAQLFLVVGVCSKGLHSVRKAVERLHRQLSTLVCMIRHTGNAPFQTEELQHLQQQLQGDALHSFQLLDHLLRGIDQRSNEMGVTLFNAFGLIDFFLVRRFLRWQGQYLGRIGQWLDMLSQLDMLTSMATFVFNEPETTEAQVVCSPTVVFQAQGLRHPFLGSGAVSNDFSIAHKNFYIITGANMAGKSTFLRAVGVNYVLAMNGMPVFANRLRVSCFKLFTSMRTSDDLTHGISYFNAELLRLKQLMDGLDPADSEATGPQQSPTTPPDGANLATLIILDEILKGTNSLDKLNGSRLFLQEMARRNVTGIVATHDLELSKMEDERFHNYCFEIELGTRVTYSYKLTPGVARNQNATYLLQQIIGKTV